MKILITLLITIQSLCMCAQSTLLKVGDKYRNFSAKTIDGKTVKLSDSINGKIAVIHLWSTWCKGCIEHAELLKPIYEKHKDKGFTVIGICNETKNTDRFKTALEKHNYPWLDLINLDNENEIWKLYGLDGGGTTLLVDKDGTILSHNVKKFDKILHEKLK